MSERDEGMKGAMDGVAQPDRDNEEHELEAEQESAEAMDADVPQPTGATETTEGQPS
ncbi:MAG TPA: hypothetical protein VNA19_05160 [Pyrinomonadaceae bacterium]|jgi:hypothetical protein|nr:hypothetical protein [Pyrinomonadaceae bacterium]